MKSLFRIAGVLFIWALVAGSLRAQTEATTTSPRVKFSELLFDFGKIKVSEVVQHEFIVTNNGNAPLEISEVTPTCGCTLAGAWDRQISPGQTGRIPIQFNPANLNGTVSKTVVVTCNDREQPKHTLELRATIWRPIDVQPAQVYFAPIEGEEVNETKVVRIISNLEQPLRLDMPHGTNPDFTFTMQTVRPDKEYELRVGYTGLVSNATPQSTISIKTSSAEMPVINVLSTVLPQPAFAVAPLQIVLPARAFNSAGYVHRQMILNKSSVPAKLGEAKVNADNISVELTEREPGRTFLLNVRFPPNFQMPDGKSLELTVHTSNSRRPVIVVPISRAAERPQDSSGTSRAPSSLPE